MGKKVFGSIGKKILFWFLVISIAPAISITFVSYRHSKKLIEKQITAILEATVHGVGEEVYHFIEDKKVKLINFSADGLIRDGLAVISSGEPNSEAIVEKLCYHLSINKLPLDHDIIEALVIDLHGKVVVSSNQKRLGMDVSNKDYFTQGWRHGIYISDLHFSEFTDVPIMTMSRVVTDVKTAHPTGMMVIVINGASVSYMVRNWSKDIPRFHDVSLRTEAYIVNEDNLMITESSFAKDTVLRQVVDTEPVKKAFFTGEEISGIYTDYRGVKVFGSSVLMDKLRWVVLAEEELTEIYQPITYLRNIGIGLSIMDAFLVIIIAFFITRSLTKPVRKLVAATERVAKGDLDFHILTTSKDEIGLLSDSFNEMIHNLKKSRGEIRALFDEGIDTMFVLSDGERIADVNKSACALLGLERNALIGRSISVLIRNSESKDRKKNVTEAIKNTWTLRAGETHPTLDVSLTSRTGEDVLCELDIKRIEYGVLAVFHDVTTRKRLEQAIVDEKQRLDDIVSEIGAGLSLVDKHMRVIWVNKIQAEWFGELKDIRGKECYRAYWNCEDVCQGCPTKKTFITGSVEKALHSHITPVGEQRWYSITSSPLRDRTGQVTQALELVEDVTEEKKSEEEFKRMHESVVQANVKLEQSIKELKITQQQLIQAEKMASMGQLAASVAHEINNPLSYVDNNLNILTRYSERMEKFIKKCEEGKPILEKGEVAQVKAFLDEVKDLKKEIKLDFVLEDFEDIIKESRSGVEQIKKIVSNLSTFSHVGEDLPRMADLNKIIEGILAMVWGELKYKAEVIKEYGDIPEIKCYPQQLGQVFMNLLTNAAHAIEGTGKITIKTYQAGNNVHVEIKDTGKGIPEEIQHRIFEPFFTTKEPGKGTGLGLTVAYNIIQKHFGRIEVSSKVGVGTTFTVVLPINKSK